MHRRRQRREGEQGMSELSVFDFKEKRLHMVGIGGSSMSGLARMLVTEGFSVSGSDSQEGYALEGLRKMGIRVYGRN